MSINFAFKRFEHGGAEFKEARVLLIVAAKYLAIRVLVIRFLENKRSFYIYIYYEREAHLG